MDRFILSRPEPTNSPLIRLNMIQGKWRKYQVTALRFSADAPTCRKIFETYAAVVNRPAYLAGSFRFLLPRPW